MKRGKIVIIILILIVLAAAVYFTFFYTKKCPDMACFKTSLAKCERVSFLNDAKDASWFYKIIGKSGGDCKVRVELLKLKEGHVDIASLEGKQMDCYLLLGAVTGPQEDLTRCSGLLKEEMQNIIINRLHAYIVDNLGQISEELKKAI